jgi:hypothetical protein
MARNKALARATVNMEDGRSVIFGEGFRTVHQVLVGTDGLPYGISWDFRNGKSVGIMLADCPEQNQLMVRGLKEKVDNEGARADVETTEDMYQAARAMVERLKAGTAFQRAAGGPVNRVDGILLEAYIRCKANHPDPDKQEQVDTATAIQRLMAMGPAGRAQITLLDVMQPFLEEVRLERQSQTDVEAVRNKAGL